MRGSLYAWVVILAFGWITTFLWVIFTTITVEHIYPWASDKIVDADSQTVLDHQKDYHNYWPLIFMGGLTIFGIVSSLKREPTDAYYSA